MSLNLSGVVTLLQVFDMPTSSRSCRDRLDLQVIQQSQPSDDCGWAWVRLDDAELMLNTAFEPEHRPSAPDPARVSAHEDTVLFFGCPDVDGAYSSLQSMGVSASPPTTAPYGMRQLSFRDPDGYGSRLQCKAL